MRGELVGADCALERLVGSRPGFGKSLRAGERRVGRATILSGRQSEHDPHFGREPRVRTSYERRRKTGSAEPDRARARRPNKTPQYQPWDDLNPHAPHGLPYRSFMYLMPQMIWVAGLVRQSLPSLAIFEPGKA